jgi:CubicO group peptidase (beta-lactamase class C family)
MYIDRLDEMIAAICEYVHSEVAPGERVRYAPLAAHALMGEAVRRTDPKGRSYRQLLEDEVLKPLRMNDTSVGVRADLRSRHVVPHFIQPLPFKHPGHSNLGPNGAFEEEHAEMPWVGCISTVPDLFRYAELLRRGGELEGVRILSPAMIEQATINRTGEKPNELYAELGRSRGWAPYPAYIGIGFSLRGEAICHHQFGTLTSPRTFGHAGAGSALFWVDPKRDLTFVCLTAGVMDEGDNVERFQRLSDLAVAAAE